MYYITHEEVGESEIPAAWKEKGKKMKKVQ